MGQLELPSSRKLSKVCFILSARTSRVMLLRGPQVGATQGVIHSSSHLWFLQTKTQAKPIFQKRKLRSQVSEYPATSYGAVAKRPLDRG